MQSLQFSFMTAPMNMMEAIATGLAPETGHMTMNPHPAGNPACFNLSFSPRPPFHQYGTCGDFGKLF